MKPLFAAALSLSFLVSAPAQAQETLYNPVQPFDVANQWYTAPNGCSYSRTQAPGYSAQWMLILNPHHIGGRRASPECPSILRG